MILMVVNNLGESAENYSVDMPNVGFPAGLTVVDVLSCREVVVDSSGSLEAQFVEGLPMVSRCSASPQNSQRLKLEWSFGLVIEGIGVFRLPPPFFLFLFLLI
jgi:alpha-amylase